MLNPIVAPSNAGNEENIDVKDVKIRVKFNDSKTEMIKFEKFCDFLEESFVPQFTRLITGYCQLFGKKFSERVLIRF